MRGSGIIRSEVVEVLHRNTHDRPATSDQSSTTLFLMEFRVEPRRCQGLPEADFDSVISAARDPLAILCPPFSFPTASQKMHGPGWD